MTALPAGVPLEERAGLLQQVGRHGQVNLRVRQAGHARGKRRGDRPTVARPHLAGTTRSGGGPQRCAEGRAAEVGSDCHRSVVRRHIPAVA